MAGTHFGDLQLGIGAVDGTGTTTDIETIAR